MRGTDERSGSLFSYVDLETRVPKDHPLRAIREIANGALSDLSADFAAMYAPLGRPSIPPEKLLRASLLQAFYTIRSERQLMERLEFDLLYRWFVGLGIDDAVWDHSVFSKNRDRLLEGDDRRQVHGGGSDAAQRQAASVDGSLLGRRHAGGSLGQHEEPQAEERPPVAANLPQAAGAMKRSTSVARSGATRHTLRPAIPTPCSIAKVRAWRPSFATSAIP